MPILEKLVQPSQARHWTDSIPLEYHYTAGVAGEEFRKELRDNGKFLSSKCPKCESTYVPARMYCPTCFIEIKEHSPLQKPGYVYSFTSVVRDKSGNKSHRPTIVVLVKFEGVKGGIVHKLDIDDPENVAVGMIVEPVLRHRSQRSGALTDVVMFKPL